MYVVTPTERKPEHEFFFQIPDDDTQYSVPLLPYIPLNVVEALEDDKMALRSVLTHFGLTDAVAALGKLDAHQIGELTLQWYRESGVAPGESSASTD